MLISLKVVAIHLAIAIESFSHVELSTRLPLKLYSVICEEEGGSLHQLCAWPASVIWGSPYSGGNSVHINSKFK